MAQRQVLMVLPGETEPTPWKIEIKCRRRVHTGAEFIARDLNGRKVGVRVNRVQRVSRSCHILHVDILYVFPQRPARVTVPLFGEPGYETPAE